MVIQCTVLRGRVMRGTATVGVVRVMRGTATVFMICCLWDATERSV